MRLLIIRHAEPDYSIDGLTEKGKAEAELLAKRLVKEDITKVYCSVFGRARLTIQPTLDRLGIEAEYCPWLREFEYARVRLEDGTDFRPWDLMPEYVNRQPKIFSPTEWMQSEFAVGMNVYDCYLDVVRELDAMLSRHGYVRDGYNYKVTNSNHDTVVLVCHFGVTAVLLSHLMNTSPYSIWQNACTLPSSVTTLYTEEREEGVASFRMVGMGDLSHLYADGASPSFMARFCECFTDDTRH